MGENFELVDEIDGFSEAKLKHLVEEAEAGYDLDGLDRQEGPGSVLTGLPQGMRAAVIQRSLQEDVSPSEIILRALGAYLRTV